MADSLETLIARWRELKSAEEATQAARREVEDAIVKLSGLNTESDGTRRITDEFKATCRVNVSIDADRLQSIAREHGMSDVLGTAFSWKPQINKRLWTQLDEHITTTLAPAITRKPGRPTFTFSEKQKKEEA